MAIRFKRSSDNHKISHARSEYVVRNSGYPYELEPGLYFYFGYDRNTVPLEVGVNHEGSDIIIVHAMKFRPERFGHLWRG